MEYLKAVSICKIFEEDFIAQFNKGSTKLIPIKKINKERINVLIKPDMSKVITEPDFFKPMETYIPVKPDWSDLNETIEKVLANYKDYQYIIDNARQKVVEMYSYQNVCMYWYNFFANQSGVDSE